MNAEIDLSKLNPRELKSYREGLAIVAHKLDAGRKESSARASEKAARTGKVIVSRMGASLAKKCFGIAVVTPPAPQAARRAVSASKLSTAPRPSTSPTVREQTNPRTRKFMSISAGSGTRQLHRIRNQGLF